MSSVPENWIPMIPVHVEGDNREVQLQRAAMLRIMEGDPDPTPEPVRPRTSLLRPGLEADPQVGYLLHEEEVSRAGVRVTQGFQRTRWSDGRAWVWLGVRKQTGRGEGPAASPSIASSMFRLSRDGPSRGDPRSADRWCTACRCRSVGSRRPARTCRTGSQRRQGGHDSVCARSRR